MVWEMYDNSILHKAVLVNITWDVYIHVKLCMDLDCHIRCMQALASLRLRDDIPGEHMCINGHQYHWMKIYLEFTGFFWCDVGAYVAKICFVNQT